MAIPIARVRTFLTRGKILAGSFSLAVALVAAVGMSPAYAAQAPVALGKAYSFAVIGGTTVTNTGPSTISGDLGVSPGTAVTGFPPGIVKNGSIHAADTLAAQAKSAVTTAYNDAAGRSRTATVSGNLGGRTLVPGVYAGGALGLTGTLTLNAQGDPNAVFVFQASSTLITASTSRVSLIGGTNPCNVYWKVGSSATLGTNSVFVGTVLALTSVSAKTGATVSGRLLARNGAVTLDRNTVNRFTCTSASTSGGTGTSSQLPHTGVPVTPLVTAGLLAILVGGLLLLTSRRPTRAPLTVRAGSGRGAHRVDDRAASGSGALRRVWRGR